MDVKLILAGGFKEFSKRIIGKQIDQDNGETNGADFIVTIKGLPAEFLKVDTKVVKKYKCLTCQSVVPEWEVQNKTGCFINHKLEEIRMDVPDYRKDVYEPYPDSIIKKHRVFDGAMRLWIDHNIGRDMAIAIWRFIDKVVPPNIQPPVPVALGTRHGILITSENDIPVIDLTQYQPEIKEAMRTDKALVCEHCGIPVAGKMGMRQHIMHKHPEIWKMKYANLETHGIEDGAKS